MDSTDIYLKYLHYYTPNTYELTGQYRICPNINNIVIRI